MIAVALSALMVAAQWWCAPWAGCGGDGSQAAPWDRWRCLDINNGVKPGDTVHLLPGRYACDSECAFRHDGVVYEGVWQGDDGPVLSDSRHGPGTGQQQTVTVKCDKCVLRRLNVTNDKWSDTTETPMGIEVFGDGVWLDSVWVYETHGGVFTAADSGQTSATYISEAYISDVGANDAGHGFYLQGPTYIDACVIEGAAHYGIQVGGTAPTSGIIVAQTMVRDSRAGGFVAAGQGAITDVRILRSAFISTPPYSSEALALQLDPGDSVEITDSFLMGGLALQTPAQPGQVNMTGNILHGGNRFGTALQSPVWDYSWTAQNYCDPTRYCAWRCTHANNRWVDPSSGCACAC